MTASAVQLGMGPPGRSFHLGTVYVLRQRCMEPQVSARLFESTEKCLPELQKRMKMSYGIVQEMHVWI
jgi:hypothetical protein